MRKLPTVLFVLILASPALMWTYAEDACPQLQLPPDVEITHNREQSILYYGDVLRSHPRCVDAELGLGRSYYAGGEYAQAVAAFDKALQLRPGDPQITAWLGRTYLKQMHPEKVLELVNRAGANIGNSASVHLLVARAYDAQDKVDDAIREIQQALKLDPRFPGAHFAEGFIAWSNGRLETAEHEYRQEMALSPHMMMTGYYLAEVLEREGNIPEAEAALAQMGHDAPGTYLYLLGMGKLDEHKKLYAAAAEQYRQAIQRAPEMLEAHYRLAVVLRALGETAQATEEFKTFSQIQARSPGGIGMAQGMGRARDRVPDFD